MDQNKPVVINWKALAYAYSDREIARAILHKANREIALSGTITWYSWEGAIDLLEDPPPNR